jgi:transposase-like protein
MTTDNLPETLLEAVSFFADEERAHAFFVTMRWPKGVHCSHCNSQDVGGMVVAGKKRNRRLWNCKACKKQFTAKQGTIMQDSPLPFAKWLPAIWMIVNAKNGISSCELARSLGITQKSAWHMSHRIREALHRGGGIFEAGTVIEADESYIGATARFMHKDVKERRGIRMGNGMGGKTAVMALLARHNGKGKSRVIARPLSSCPQRKDANSLVHKYVLRGAELHTDQSKIYEGLSPFYVHKVVNHAEAYVQNGVHTNGMENFWCLLKRTLKGTHVHCAPFHLFRYLDDQCFRFNERKQDDQGRFLCAVATAKDRTLTWKRLTADKTIAPLPEVKALTPKVKPGMLHPDGVKNLLRRLRDED